MNESPPLRATKYEIEREFGTAEGSALFYVASLFKTTLSVYPGAIIRITGNNMTAGGAQDRLVNVLGLPVNKVVIVPDWNAKDDTVNIVIVYMAAHEVRRKVWVRFAMDLELPIDVEFEVSPDGAYVEEIKAQFDKLKTTIRKHAGRVENLKIAAKVEGAASFDRATSVKVETALKAKIKAALSAEVRVPGLKKKVTIEFYAAAGIKRKDDNTVKPFFEGGAMLTIPHDLF